jgi:hypothetical protein
MGTGGISMPEEDQSDESIYGEARREELIDGDQLSPEEEAFMRGYEEADSQDDDEEDIA